MRPERGLESYRALILLAKLSLLDDMTSDDWQRWAPFILLNTAHKDDKTASLDELLLRHVFEHAPSSVTAQITQLLESEAEEDKHDYHVDSVLMRLKHALITDTDT